MSIRVVLRRLGLMFGAVVLAGLGYTGWQAWLSSRPVVLPALAGPYRVGRSAFDWTDDARIDPLAPHRSARRLPVWVWYPASPSAGRAAPYLPGAWSGLHFAFPVGLAETRPSAVRPTSAADPPPLAGRFPIVVLEPGLGFSSPQYSSLAEGIAAQGYYVVGVTPTYSANVAVLDGRAVAATDAGLPSAFDSADLHSPTVTAVADRLTAVWAADARFAANHLVVDPRLGLHADRRSTAYVGHSFGGSAALEACRLDDDCSAAVDLDGTQYGAVVRTGLRQPVMIVQSGGSCVTGTCTNDSADPGDIRVARELLAASPGPHRCYAADDAGHFSFTDYGAYHLAYPLRRLLPLGNAPGQAVLTQTASAVTAFLTSTPARTPLLRPHAC